MSLLDYVYPERSTHRRSSLFSTPREPKFKKINNGTHRRSNNESGNRLRNEFVVYHNILRSHDININGYSNC